jgi:hypothetical protein
MEGLIFLVAEALGILVLPIAFELICLFLEVFFLMSEAGVLVFRQASPTAPKKFRRWVHRIALGGAVAFLVAWVLMEFVCFQPIVKGVTQRIAERSGIEISYASAGGTLSTGRVVLRGMTARRTLAGQDAFDLRVDELEIDARPLSLLRSELSLESIRVRGVRGRYERLAGVERKPRKPFTSDVLEIVDATIDWILHRDGKPDFALPLAVERLEVRPFDSVNAAFAVLFRSDGKGTIAGAPWEIAGQGAGVARRTTWKAAAVPVELLASYLGEPFDWFRSGTVDVDVADSWVYGPKVEVDLRWHLRFHDLKVAVPERIEGLKRRLGDAVAALANRHPKELPLEFTMTLDKRGLMGRMSIEALELWDSLAAGLIEELAERSGVAAETIRELGRTTWTRLKSWMERRARGKR